MGASLVTESFVSERVRLLEHLWALAGSQFYSNMTTVETVLG